MDLDQPIGKIVIDISEQGISILGNKNITCSDRYIASWNTKEEKYQKIIKIDSTTNFISYDLLSIFAYDDEHYTVPYLRLCYIKVNFAITRSRLTMRFLKVHMMR